MKEPRYTQINAHTRTDAPFRRLVVIFLVFTAAVYVFAVVKGRSGSNDSTQRFFHFTPPRVGLHREMIYRILRCQKTSSLSFCWDSRYGDRNPRVSPCQAHLWAAATKNTRSSLSRTSSRALDRKVERNRSGRCVTLLQSQ